MIRKALVLTAIVCLFATTAMAKPWTYPGEVSVAEVYNTLYGTNYSETTMEGLGALHNDHGLTMDSTFNTSDFGFLRVEAFDTSSTDKLTVRFGQNFSQSLDLFDPGAWTSPTRGYLPGGDEFINLGANNMLGQNADFRLYVGNTLLTQSNTLLFEGDSVSQLLGYNGGGFSGDKDFNEPVIQMSKTPIPGAVYLLGSGLAGLIGLRRRNA